jgi:SAM-dependent methyltransferase
LGCGDNKLDGWRNSDDDIRTILSTVTTSSADFILVEHVVEHLSGPEMLRFFDECYRCLKTGGTLRLCVPELDSRMTLEHKRDLIFGHGHLQVMSYAPLEMALTAARFDRDKIELSERKDCDGHWRVIGIEKDDLETLRVEAVK